MSRTAQVEPRILLRKLLTDTYLCLSASLGIFEALSHFEQFFNEERINTHEHHQISISRDNDVVGL
jgi:hypothetical protein